MSKDLTYGMILITISATMAAADEPLIDTLKNRFQSEPLKLGALVQVVGTYESGDSTIAHDGFMLANFRVSIGGKLDEGWGYFLQASFTRTPAFLDATVRYRRWTAAGFDLGAFKAPFSAELLTSAASIDFVNRSQAAALLSPGRQVGIVARGEFDSGFGYALGALNGNGLSAGNDDNHLMGVGRATYSDSFEDGSVRVGLNAFQSQDTDAPIGLPIRGDFFAEGFSGKRMGYGVDVRFTYRAWLASAEFIGARYDPRGGTRVEPDGYHMTAGYKPADDTQVLLRWDSFAGDGAVADSDLIILGLNYWPTSPTEFQINAVIPTTGARDLQLLANLQLGF